ncbi:hypothetical protein Bca52824_008702 [Brassica carinata]|uniref:Secreted protein n=1 Tax=Brassica carinata TaxID=52824 RepID=A0A8X8B6B3_BRACI|nr:hypothetical protein Bca52824_008702 [Brassica carinata]
MWSSMALWLLLVVPPRFVAPTLLPLVTSEQERRLCVWSGVFGVRFVRFVEAEMESNSSLNCSSVLKTSSGVAVLRVVDRHVVALGLCSHPSASQAHLVLFGGVASLFYAGLEAQRSGSSGVSTRFLHCPLRFWRCSPLSSDCLRSQEVWSV